MKHILVTGATGFVGQHLVKALQSRGYKVTALAKKVDQKREPHLSFFQVDITRWEQFRVLPRSVDAVIHIAAFIPKKADDTADAQCFAVNVIGTYNVLRYAIEAQAKRFVYSSSISVYGTVTKGKIDESYRANPQTIYGLTKKLGEDVVSFFSATKGLSAAILRYPSVYGPGMQPTTIIPRFLENAKKEGKLTINGSGKRTQDFVYVDDIVQANILSLKSSAHGLYLIGSGQQVSLKKLAQTVKNNFPKIRIVYDATQPDDPQRICFDFTKASKDFGYTPKWSLEEGIKQLL